MALRATLGLPSEHTTGFRLVHAEGDGLPGLIVDRFGDVLAVQLATIGMKRREALVLEALSAVLSPRAIVDRTSHADGEDRGLRARLGRRAAATSLAALEFVERGLRFRIPLELGQKTGFYFDQRVAPRARRAARARRSACSTPTPSSGAFAIAAARGGAREVVAVDESALAIEVGAECAAMNGVGDRVKFVKEDARRALADAHGSFDLVVADPPRLAPTRGAREQALVAYTKLAENACRATRPGGVLVLCSCSAAVDLAALTRALATGATHAERAGDGARAMVPGRGSPRARGVRRGALPQGAHRARRAR